MLNEIRGIVSQLYKSKKYWIITQGCSIIFQFLGAYVIASSLEQFYVNLSSEKKVGMTLLIYLGVNIVFKMSMNFVEQYYTPNLYTIVREELYDLVLKSINRSNRMEVNSSKMLSDITQKLENITDIITNYIASFITSLILLSMFSVIICNTSIVFGIVYLGIFLMSTLIHILFFSKMNELKEQVQRNISHGNTCINEMTSGISTVKAYRTEERCEERYIEISENILSEQLRYEEIFSKHEFYNNLLYYLSEIMPVLLGGVLLLLGEFSLGKVMFLIQFTQYLTIYMIDFSESFCQIKSSKSAFVWLNRLINESATDDRPELEFGDDDTLLELEHVKVAFEGEVILDDCSFQCKRGEVIAIVGESGAGKSTLLNSIMQFNEYEGKCKLGGKNASNFSTKSVQNYIAYMSQNEMLIGVSIMDNIRMGNLQANEKEIKRAAKNANVLEFIEELPDGFGTIVGKKGTDLSGGQIQRICLARAMLKNAPIMLLDEPTSALDALNEQELVSRITETNNNGCVLMVTHRLNSLKNVSKILVLQDGRIEAEGTYSELFEKSDYFREMCKRCNEN